MEKAEREKKRKGWKRSWGMVEEMAGGEEEEGMEKEVGDEEEVGVKKKWG